MSGKKKNEWIYEGMSWSYMKLKQLERLKK